MSPNVLDLLNNTETLPDEEVVRRILQGETALFELIMRLQPASLSRRQGHSAR